jgi:uncharacterized protein
MRKIWLCLLVVLLSVRGVAQSYEDGITKFREQYIKDLLAEPRKPIQPSQVKGISFFKADKSYCVEAMFTASPGAEPFLINTHSGKQKPFKEYGTLSFTLSGQQLVLHVYKSMDMINANAHAEELFIPFNDATNYDLTYGGGRYIDLLTTDIKDNKVTLDFNKCYNPYCAYTDGFSCPIPPAENRLPVEIYAGEKMFQR